MKKELNNYSTIAGLGEIGDWSYCAFDKMWYEDEKEIFPEPEAKNSSWFICDIKVDYYAEPYYEWEEAYKENDLEDFIKDLGKNSSNDDINSAILFEANDCRYIINCNQYGILDLEEFVRKIKERNFAVQYIEQHCAVKLFGWRKENNKIHFALQSYNFGFENDYLKIVFSVILDENQLIEGLETIINKWKKTIYD